MEREAKFNQVTIQRITQQNAIVNIKMDQCALWIMNRMTIACLAGLAFAGGLTAWTTINRYKGRGSRDKKRIRKVAEEQEYDEDIAEQLAQTVVEIPVKKSIICHILMSLIVNYA